MEIAARPDVIFCTFGDMLRVPGSREDLFGVRSRGGDVRVVYSPLDAIAVAQRHPDRQVVFLAVGFETTAPASAAAVVEAARLDLATFAVLASHVRVPPAMEAILNAPGNRVEAFLAAGHVCTVMGAAEYHPLAERHRVPIVVTGFEPVDLLEGIARAVGQLERGAHEVEIQYGRSARPDGNPSALAALNAVFAVADAEWRGIGTLPASGLVLQPRFARFDAHVRFPTAIGQFQEPEECRSGLVLAGRMKPSACPAFGTRCTPDH